MRIYVPLLFHYSGRLETPISVLRQQSDSKFDKFKSILRERLPSAEIKPFFVLYIPFLVALLRPTYAITRVFEALQTSLFSKDDYNTWIAWKDITYVYDLARNTWVEKRLLPTENASQENTSLDFGDLIDYQSNYPAEVRIHIPGFKSFNMSQDLQLKARKANREQSGCILTPGYSLFAYEWVAGVHDPVMYQALEDLVS